MPSLLPELQARTARQTTPNRSGCQCVLHDGLLHERKYMVWSSSHALSMQRTHSHKYLPGICIWRWNGTSGMSTWFGTLCASVPNTITLQSSSQPGIWLHSDWHRNVFGPSEQEPSEGQKIAEGSDSSLRVFSDVQKSTCDVVAWQRYYFKLLIPTIYA